MINPRWADAEQTRIIVQMDDGAAYGFPAVEGQPDYDALIADGAEIGPYVPPPPAPSLVDAERDRRIADGFVFGGVPYQMDEGAQMRITAMGAAARFAVAGGALTDDLRWADPDTDFGWIATDNSVTPMDAQTVSAMAGAAAAWVTAHFYAGRAIKNLTPIPADYDADHYWPASAPAQAEGDDNDENDIP